MRSLLSLGQACEDLLLFGDGQHAENLHDTGETTILVAAHESGDVVSDSIDLHLLDALGDALAVLLVPDSDVHVVSAEGRELRPGLEGLEAGGARGGELAGRSRP